MSVNVHLEDRTLLDCLNTALILRFTYTVNGAWYAKHLYLLIRPRVLGSVS